MIKTRLIPVLYIKNGLIVRSEGFTYHQNIGNVIDEAKRYNQWNVDELIYIDISREKFYDLRRDDLGVKSYKTIKEIIEKISNVCFMPLAFGGGIRNIQDVDFRIRNGADKVVLNTGAFLNPGLITEVSEKYGSQAAVISVDYKMVNNKPMVYIEYGQKSTNLTVFEWIEKCAKAGAGEIFLNSIDRDGMANGYDLKTIKKVVGLTNLPVVACGGAGKLADFVKLAKSVHISGIAAGNIFHFTELSYPNAKKMLIKEGLNFR